MRRVLALGVLAALMLAACGAGSGTSGSERTLTVFAAASLKDSFEELKPVFEAAHPGVRVSFSFAGSSDLVAQLGQGAPADVLASADAVTMAAAVDDDLIAGEPVSFAANTLQIVTPPGNPGGLRSLEDLADPALQVVLCSPAVPCGAATQTVEDLAGVDIAPASEEQSVTDVLNKVSAGEADAGLVYVTDVKAAGSAVEGLAFPEAARAVNTYPIAAVRGSGNERLARAFIDLVTGPEGQSVLASAGFADPPP